MSKTKNKSTKQESKSDSAKQGSLLKTIMKWIGIATAALSLVFGVQQLTKMIFSYYDEQDQIANVLSQSEIQQAGHDYAAAWASLKEAEKLDKNNDDVQKAQENLAMDWLINIRVTTGEQTLTDIVDRVLPALSRGIINSSGTRKADILAHIGWADFLRWRDGNRALKPQEQYFRALAIDSSNVYANALLGHWLLWSGKPLDEAKKYFAAAVFSGKQRSFVRKKQLEALINRDDAETEVEIIKVCNAMRQNDAAIELGSRKHIFWIYTRTSGRIRSADAATGKFPNVIPPLEELQTFQWLFDDWQPAAKSRLREYCLANLQEAAGQHAAALQTFKSLQNAFTGNNLLIKKMRLQLFGLLKMPAQIKCRNTAILIMRGIE